MVCASSTSTSSAHVEGQSCGQAEAPMRAGEGFGRTIWCIAAPALLLRRLLALLVAAVLLGATPHATHHQQQDRAGQGREQRDVVEAFGAELRLEVALDHRIGHD